MGGLIRKNPSIYRANGEDAFTRQIEGNVTREQMDIHSRGIVVESQAGV